MKIGRRGSLNVKVTVHGTQGHVAYPERLDNAIHRLSALIEALVREPIDQGSTHFQPTSLQFTTVDVGNPATNIAPGVVKARFNTRFNDLWTSKTLLAHLQERMDRANAALGGNGLFERNDGDALQGQHVLGLPVRMSAACRGCARRRRTG